MGNLRLQVLQGAEADSLFLGVEDFNFGVLPLLKTLVGATAGQRAARATRK